MIKGGTYYSLSRPRRFGKSLLLSTLREIFLGNKELFKGLWIYDKIDWQPHPVITLDFSEVLSDEIDFAESLNREMDLIAKEHGMELHSSSYDQKFRELIEGLGKEKKVAILVDEYDKPIINHIDNLELAQRNREIMKHFYSVIKGNDKHIAFFLLTGVSKFSQVSIFSDLNNLNDITLARNFSQLLGYTSEEIKKYFPGYLEELASNWEEVYPDIDRAIKEWYDGYTWDGENYVYNPFSVLNLFFKSDFGEYWFATGTPTFLLKLIKDRIYSVFDLENRTLSLRAFNKFDIPNLEINSLLFQTGYLTIKKRDKLRQTVTLDFPNKEVANAFSFHLLSEFAEKSQERTDSLILKMTDQLHQGLISDFIESLKALFAGISFPLHPAGKEGIENHEKYYHSMFYLVLNLLGYEVSAEVITNLGRIDAVISTQSHFYIVEFKIGNAGEAIGQIKANQYPQKFQGQGKAIVLIGIGFEVQQRNIGSYLIEEYTSV